MPFLIILGGFLIFMQFYSIAESDSHWADFKARCEERNGSAARTADGNHLCVKKEQAIQIIHEEKVEDKPKEAVKKEYQNKLGKRWWEDRDNAK